VDLRIWMMVWAWTAYAEAGDAHGWTACPLPHEARNRTGTRNGEPGPDSHRHNPQFPLDLDFRLKSSGMCRRQGGFCPESPIHSALDSVR